ncbi:Zn-dependent M28 family amino/carboxypeptidase, partial [Geomicrobium halophilum]
LGAEEIGLVGGFEYVDQLSDSEIDRSVANFNMDMVGTAWEPATQLYVNVVDGQPNTVWEQADSAAQRLDNDILFLFERGASDHVAFHEAGIDAANFIWREPGTHDLEPWYHTPEDTIDNVSPEKIQQVGDLIDSAVSDLILS